VTHSLAAARARRARDLAALHREAPAFADYGASQGIPAVSAEAAVQWLEAGEPGQALDLLHQPAGGGLDSVARDVDFLLTAASLVQVAATLSAGDALASEIAADGVRLLEPYAGRAVLNSGAVIFHGVVDEFLFRACQASGDPAAARWREGAASRYRRIGAAWWLGRLAEPGPHGQPSPATALATARAAQTVIHLRRDGAGWTVGFDGATFALPDLKGLHYLRHLLRRPGADVTAADLAAAAAGHAGVTVTESGGGEIIDARALAAYRQRLRDIDAELDEAGSWADEARTARLRLERDALPARPAAGSPTRPARRPGCSTPVPRADYHRRAVARRAPSASASNLAQTIFGWISGM
jgi:hypothetical protein